MKRYALLIILSGFSLMSAAAQPTPDRPRGKPASPVQQLMQDLREQDPAEFNRLQNLRAEDPEAFRAHMRGMMEDRIMKTIERERPGIHHALSGLSPEDRGWLIKQLEARPFGPSAGPAERSHDRRGGKNGQAKIRALVQEYRTSQDEARKSELKKQIREAMSSEYDERIRMRTGQLQELESKIEDLRKALAMGEEEKQRFLDRKLSIWLEEKPAQQ